MTDGEWKKQQELFTAICHRFVGTLGVNEPHFTEMVFTDKHEVKNFYKDGSVADKANTWCTIGIERRAYGVNLFGEEKTYRIQGGFSGSRFTEENLVKELKRFGFIEKPKENMEQLSFL